MATVWSRVPHKENTDALSCPHLTTWHGACQSPGTSSLTSREQRKFLSRALGVSRLTASFSTGLCLDRGAGTCRHLSGPLKPGDIIQRAMQERGWRVSDLEQDDTSEVTPACEREGPGQANPVLS